MVGAYVIPTRQGAGNGLRAAGERYLPVPPFPKCTARSRLFPMPALLPDPNGEHEWLTVPEAARLLGISRQALHHRISGGRVPFEWRGHRRLIRRDLLEQVERARHASRTRNP